MSLVRENGLRAAAYVAVIDLHPQVADVMLAALAAEGVAAYAAPVASNRGLLLPTQFPTGPLDRLFVDREAYDTARRVLDEHLPSARAELEHAPVEAAARTGAGGDEPVAAEPTDPSRDPVDDETWSKIVATFHGGGLERPAGRAGSTTRWTGRPGAGRARPGPTAEDLDADGAERRAAPPREPPRRRQAARRRTTTATSPRHRRRCRSRTRPPASPGPVSSADPCSHPRAAARLGARLVGPARRRHRPRGFVTLVARMRDADDDPDNGAVV